MSRHERKKLSRTISKSVANSIKKAVIQNNDRILQEIQETKELYELMQKWSAGGKLSKLEKMKVKTQLIDICKAIPALAIFILPFGSIVLIFLFKFLPFNILPTAFYETPEIGLTGKDLHPGKKDEE